ncbi:hypothetical protein [Mariniplasma anaerobium]|uniref:Uncharacterized protein n=1 Tax=Mariniplasma anaerobium TaxID=2735436 RepID=A0A7U9THK1_9MOLU|nr:hypothetical protein [Mariniplasma anaerobium]BCR36606.1 hypothetical protein MPAN_014990 [Mariniplasma anaerobium]
MSKNKSNNVKQVKATLVRTKAILEAIKKETKFRKDDGLENQEIPIHPGQLKMHLFPVFNPGVKS